MLGEADYYLGRAELDVNDFEDAFKSMKDCEMFCFESVKEYYERQKLVNKTSPMGESCTSVKSTMYKASAIEVVIRQMALVNNENVMQFWLICTTPPNGNEAYSIKRSYSKRTFELLEIIVMTHSVCPLFLNVVPEWKPKRNAGYV